jgi:L-fuconolactonase
MQRHDAHEDEPPIDPALPIIDPHQHFWDIPPQAGSLQAAQCFLLPEMLAAIEASGHDVTHTVFVQCYAMYRAEGPEAMKPVGEVEFANGIAAMSASGRYGPRRLAAAIVGSADLTLGSWVAPVLEAEIAAAGGRLRGIRMNTAYSAGGMFGMPCDPHAKGLMMQPRFREGVGILASLGLSLDVWCFHSQLPELIDLASAFPDLPIILDHLGTPETLGIYRGREDAAFAEWRAHIVELARRPNVVVKLGGLGMDVAQMIGGQPERASSAVLADRWRPSIETCIEAFTPARCMFESNFPPDAAACGYGTLWNAFKRIAAGCSPDEKEALFSGAAKRVYLL